MTMTGTLVIENFQYGVTRVDLDVVGPDGQPTGEKVPRVIFAVKPMNSDVIVEMRIQPEHLDAILSALTKVKIVVPTMADLRLVKDT